MVMTMLLPPSLVRLVGLPGAMARISVFRLEQPKLTLVLTTGAVEALAWTTLRVTWPVAPTGTVKFKLTSLVRLLLLVFRDVTVEPILTIRVLEPIRGLLEPLGPTGVLARTVPTNDALLALLFVAMGWLSVSMTLSAIAFLRFSGELTVMVRLLIPMSLELLTATGASFAWLIPMIVRLQLVPCLTSLFLR